MNIHGLIQTYSTACRFHMLQVDTKHPVSLVSIKTDDGLLILQGQEADEFRTKVHSLWDELGNITRADAELYYAYDYLHLLMPSNEVAPC